MLFSYVLLLNHVNTNMAELYKSNTFDTQSMPPRGANYRSWRNQNIIKDLMENNTKHERYDKNIRPRPTGPVDINSTANAPPVIVTTKVIVKSISTVKEQNMEFKAQFRFQQEWYDERLIFTNTQYRDINYLQFVNDPEQQIWLPDTFFQNEKEGNNHMIDQENYFIRVRHDGYVTYNRRLSMTFACVMKLFKYPMDQQSCEILFASYAYTTYDIIYVWDDVPIELKPDATQGLPNFVLMSYGNGTCSSTTTTGSYSCLMMQLTLKRVFSFFLLQLYIPSSMLVAVSWISYWIDWRATAGRVPLAIVTLLTMITQSHVINANLPPVSYTKAIDVWIGACVMFIFGSLVEYAFVNYTGIREQRRKQSASISPSASFMSPFKRRRLGGSFLDKLLRRVQKQDDDMVYEERRRMEQQQFQHDTALIAHLESQERVSLLRRRSAEKSRQYYTADDPGSALRQRASPSRGGQPLLSDMAVHFEDISDNVDWIRLRTRRRVELFKWCTIFKQRGRAERIDFMSRIVFPSAFLLFNIVYWTAYW